MVRPVVKCKIGETGQTLQTEKNICGIITAERCEEQILKVLEMLKDVKKYEETISIEGTTYKENISHK
ncbi:hypothetical protein YC2023_087619 [Brassica napus]